MYGGVRRWLSSRSRTVAVEPAMMAHPAPAAEGADAAAGAAADREAVGVLEQDVVAAMRRLAADLASAEHFSTEAEARAGAIHASVPGMRAATASASANSVALVSASQQLADAAEQIGSSMSHAQERLDAAATRAGEATEMMGGLARPICWR